MKPSTVIALLCVCAVAQVAIAQEALPLAADPLIYQREGVAVGCGVRLTGGEPNSVRPSIWFDVSFNVFRRGVAIAQAIGYEIRRSGFEGDSVPSRVPLQSAWLKAANGQAKLGENAQRVDTLVYTLLIDDALTLFEAVGQGQPLSLGIKRWGERVESVYSGTAALTDQSRQQIADCLDRLLE